MIIDAAAAKARFDEVDARLDVPWWSLRYPVETVPDFLRTCRSVARSLLATPLDQSEGDIRWNAAGDVAIGDACILADDTKVSFAIQELGTRVGVRTANDTLIPRVALFRDALGAMPIETQYPETLVSAPEAFAPLVFSARDVAVRLAIVELYQQLARIDCTHAGAIQAMMRDHAAIAQSIRDILANQPRLQAAFGEDPIRAAFALTVPIRAALRKVLRQSAPPPHAEPLLLLGRGVAASREWHEAADRGMQTDEMLERGMSLVAQAFAWTDPEALAVLHTVTRATAPHELRTHSNDLTTRLDLYLGYL